MVILLSASLFFSCHYPKWLNASYHFYPYSYIVEENNLLISWFEQNCVTKTECVFIFCNSAILLQHTFMFDSQVVLGLGHFYFHKWPSLLTIKSSSQVRTLSPLFQSSLGVLGGTVHTISFLDLLFSVVRSKNAQNFKTSKLFFLSYWNWKGTSE